MSLKTIPSKTANANSTLRPSAGRAISRRLAIVCAIGAFASPVIGCANRSRIGELFHSGHSGNPDAASDGGVASGSGGSAYPDGGLSGDRALTSASKLDILFMVDDSASMAPIQSALARSMSQFVTALGQAKGGLPDLHLAVASSSLGAGAFGDVPGCMAGPPGDDGGKFQHRVACGLNAGQTFLTASADGKANNFTGDLAGVFGCMAQIGDQGCGFEHQLGSTRQALIKAANARDPDNGGFLRDDAYLAIVLLTNEDDCSVPADSQLFDTAVASVNDQPPLGGLWSYRCNEFGHRCDQPLPHFAAGLPITLTGCTSKENTDGLYHLTPVAEFADFLLRIKTDSSKVSVAAITGPTGPYVVGSHVAQLPSGATEMQPQIGHSCSTTSGVYADPAIRLTQLVDTFAPNGIIESLCADDLGPAVTRIANRIVGGMTP